MRLKMSTTILLAIASCGAEAAARPEELVAAAKSQIGITLRYDPRYEKIAYPGGDVPIERGVCTDVVIRAYRKLGLDLQQLVHEDMANNWKAYPKLWGLKRPDRHIDHRRVPNLAVFFGRHGTALPITRDGRQYRAGDIVTWNLPGNLPHIGIVADEISWTGVPLVIHNIGSGTKIENALFSYPLTGHFRFQRALR